MSNALAELDQHEVVRPTDNQKWRRVTLPREDDSLWQLVTSLWEDGVVEKDEDYPRL